VAREENTEMGLEKCVRHKGKIYCWNTDTEQIEEIVRKPLNISDCPEIVVFDLMRLLGREMKAKEE
jgi:hypothetical protein